MFSENDLNTLDPYFDVMIFLNKILSVIGVDSLVEHRLNRVNVGRTKYFYEYNRILNIITGKYLKFCSDYPDIRSLQFQNEHTPINIRISLLRWGVTIDRHIFKRSIVSTRIKQQLRYDKIASGIIQSYGKSNKILCKTLGIDLKSFGYL